MSSTPVDGGEEVPEHGVGFHADALGVGVAVAACLAEQDDRDLQPRPRHKTVLDSALDAGVCAARIAHERDPGVQRLAQVHGRLQGGVRERGTQQFPLIHRGRRHVAVAVEDSRHQPETAQIEGGRVRRRPC
jgi:hypothetical protein